MNIMALISCGFIQQYVPSDFRIIQTEVSYLPLFQAQLSPFALTLLYSRAEFTRTEAYERIGYFNLSR